MLAHTEKISAKSVRSRYDECGPEPDARNQLAEGEDLSDLLGLENGAELDDIIRVALLSPVEHLTSNRGKRIRGQLVHLGYRLVAEDSPASAVAIRQCGTCAEVVELIHAGSLVVDDIEDGSRSRRGKPALHIRYGLPIALNAGNWLYFWPFELIRQLDLPDQKALEIYKRYHRTLLRAHFGQAIDLGGRVEHVPQPRVPQVCIAAMELKTGALMGFATALGAAIGGGTETVISVLNDFGRDLGVALQMYDDLGNVLGIREPVKKQEDLMLCRPSWAWACAATMSSRRDYEKFLAAVGKLPDARELEAWIDRHDLIQAMRESARQRLEAAFKALKNKLEAEHARWSKRGFEELRRLGEEIAVAYG
jgi:geranylgeranyl pyrophosphate synthase